MGHLFIHCTSTTFIWKFFFQVLGISWVTHPSKGVRLYVLNPVDDVNKLIYSLINIYSCFIHVMDSIFHDMNDGLFYVCT